MLDAGFGMLRMLRSETETMLLRPNDLNMAKPQKSSNGWE